MVSSFFSRFVTFVCLASGALSIPLKQRSAQVLPPNTSPVRRTEPVSLDGWGGFQSLQGFDNFYGVGNFDGSLNQQIIIQENQLVCRQQQIEIVQQRLVILQEMAKRVVTELICDVETQTIVIQQFNSGFGAFSNDLGRLSNKQVGFDQNIASQLGGIINQDGSLNVNDLNFNGQDVGKQTVVPTGNNWDQNASPERVEEAKKAAEEAAKNNEQNNEGNNNEQNNEENNNAESSSVAESSTTASASASSTEAAPAPSEM